MTECDPPFVTLPNNFQTIAKLHEKNQTYDVTNIAGGLSHEIWKILEEKLNFTTSLYKRKDSEWGSLQFYDNNGTIGSNGMIRNVLEQSADVVVASLFVLLNRIGPLKYLPIVGSDRYHVFIRNHKEEELRYDTFSRQLLNTIENHSLYKATMAIVICLSQKRKKVSLITTSPSGM
jgi:hypothetical protein